MYEEFLVKLKDEKFRKNMKAMRKAFITALDRISSNKEYIANLREFGKNFRKEGLDIQLIERAKEKMKENGFNVYFAKDSKEALKIILSEIGKERLIVKSKSNITKEIELAEALAERGIEVIETDLGDRIVQIGNEKSVHPTGPAAHLSKEFIAKLLSMKFKKNVEANAEKIIEILKNDIIEYIEKANIGITGANAIGSEEGAVVILHNEGNIAEVMRKKKHIIITSIEKIYSNLEEALRIAKIQAYYATGSLTSYINIISGLSKTADIEKELYRGVHSPKEVCIILLDNKRSKVEREFRSALNCIGCGYCLLKCPAYNALSYNFSGKGHYGGIGTLYEGFTNSVSSAVDKGLYACTNCLWCGENCPMDIEIPELIKEMRAKAIDSGIRYNEHEVPVKNMGAIGDVYGFPHKFGENDKEGLPLFVGCQYRRMENEMKTMISVLAKLGIKFHFTEEKCCGYLALALGYKKDFENIKKNFLAIFPYKKFYTICPTCTLTLKQEYGLEPIPLIKAVYEKIENIKVKGNLKITWHDPCKFGRGIGLIDEPREILGKFYKLLEMKNHGKETKCCGGGGGLLATNIRIADEIGKIRIEEAVDTGADAIVTSCPTCEQRLFTLALRYRKEVGRIKVLSFWDAIYSVE
ncbi:MAG: LUD domain-containing protein [Candidatus Thermoplasmatota archaeon]